MYSAITLDTPLIHSLITHEMKSMKPITLWGILKDNMTGEFIDIMYTQYPDTFSFKARILILNPPQNEQPNRLPQRL